MERGTATLGMTVAETLRRKRKITSTTSTTVSIISNCTSATEARMVVVRVGGGGGDREVLEAQAVGGKGGGVGVDAPRRPLPAADADQAHSRKLRDLLGQGGVGQVLHLREREGVGGQGEGQDGRVRRV